MNIPQKYLLLAAIILAVIIPLHWGEPLTVLVEATLVSLSFFGTAWLEQRRSEIERPLSRNLPRLWMRYRTIEARWKRGILLVVIVYVAFLTRYGSVENFVAHRSQHHIQARVDGLMGAGHWHEAAQYLIEKLRRSPPAGIRTALQWRLLDCWLLISDSASDEELSKLMATVRSLANGRVVDQALVKNLSLYVEHRKILAIQAKHTAQTAAQLKSEADKAGLALKDAADTAIRLKGEADHTRFSLLVAWGDSLTADLPARRTKYQEAIDFGRPLGFDMRQVQQRLLEAESLLAQQQPRDFLLGAHGKLLSWSSDRFPPTLDAEISLCGPSGQPIQGLTEKDFRVEVAGQPARPLAVGFSRPQAQRLQVVILVDCSGSTAGAAIAAAKAGVQQLLQQLDGQADVQLIAFSEAINPLTNWGTNSRSASQRLAPLEARGGTALNKALSAAVDALQTRPNPRLVVLFTDGKDSAGGIDPAVLVARLRQEQIKVHCVGLETAEFDRAAIERFTTATAGTLVTASLAGELAQRFTELSQALSAPRYRLVIPCREPRGTLRIQVGGQNAVRLEASLEASPDVRTASK